MSHTQRAPAPAADVSTGEAATLTDPSSPSATPRHATNASLPLLALAPLPVDAKEALVVIAHIDGHSACVGRAGEVQRSIELVFTVTWRDEENLRRLFAAVELDPRRCVLFLVVADYRPAHEDSDTTVALFESLGLAGLYYDDPTSCARCCPLGVPPARAAWCGAEAISALSDFWEQAVIWRARFDESGPHVMKSAGGCRGGVYNKLVPLRQTDGSLRNPRPGWVRVSGF